MPEPRKPNLLMPLVAGLLAWLVPGAGHVYLGRTTRGIILCICINAMFWSGMAVGGVFTIEPLTQKWWFAAQVCSGASGAAAWYRQQHVRRNITTRLGITPTPPRSPIRARQWHEEYTEALVKDNLNLNYPADNVARAYTGVAGMLNLMAMFDAMMLGAIGRLGEPPPRKKRPPEEQEEEQ